MAGTLEITETLCWMPAGWIFDNLMERVASIIGDSNTTLASQLLDARTIVGLGYLDLRNSTEHDRRVFLHGVEVCLKRTELAGATAFHDPDFFSGFVKEVNQLRTLLRTSLADRANTNEDQTE